VAPTTKPSVSEEELAADDPAPTQAPADGSTAAATATTTTTTAPAAPVSDHPNGVNLGSKVSTTSVCAEINEFRANNIDYLGLAGQPPLTCRDSAAIDALIASTLDPPGDYYRTQRLAEAIMDGSPGVGLFSPALNSVQDIGNGGLAGGSYSGWYLYEETVRIGEVGCWNVFWWDAATNTQTGAYITCAFNLAD
jgi:hypothetical protein